MGSVAQCKRGLRAVVMSLMIAASALGSGCKALPPELEGLASRDGSTPAGHVLEFAQWIGGASEKEVRDARSVLERSYVQRDDATTPLRLAYLLYESDPPNSDPRRASKLLEQFLKSPEYQEYRDLHNLAQLLLRNWNERAALVAALGVAQARSDRAHTALQQARRQRKLAEKHVEALIKVERRANRTSESIKEVKPTSP